MITEDIFLKKKLIFAKGDGRDVTACILVKT